MLWYGAIADVPSGWHLCNGLMGSPDLRNVFVFGAGDTYAPGASGGSLTHSHGYTGPLHTHTLEAGDTIPGGTAFSSLTDQSRMVDTTDTESHLPNYHALCYIMKIN